MTKPPPIELLAKIPKLAKSPQLAGLKNAVGNGLKKVPAAVPKVAKVGVDAAKKLKGAAAPKLNKLKEKVAAKVPDKIKSAARKIELPRARRER